MTHINGERVELVTSFESLRAGDVVYVRNCLACGRTCRSILVRLVRSGRYVFDDGDDASTDCWAATPHCGPAGDTLGQGIPGATVAEGRVYRVVLNLEAPATTEPARRPERVR